MLMFALIYSWITHEWDIYKCTLQRFRKKTYIIYIYREPRSLAAMVYLCLIGLSKRDVNGKNVFLDHVTEGVFKKEVY